MDALTKNSKWDSGTVGHGTLHNNQSQLLSHCLTVGTATLAESILSVEVSCFANYKTPDNPKTVNLLTWLTSSQYQKQVEIIQESANKKERDRMKSNLPAITPSGLFTRREEAALIQHSGLVCLDIDPKGNEGITNYADLKRQLCRLPNVAYCGRSVSGTGYFVLIPIAYPAQHGLQFRALREIFQKKYGVRIDDTPDVSRLRGYSFDADSYFNHCATPFRGVYSPPSIPVRNTNPAYRFPSDDFARIALQRCVRLIEEAQDGQKHAQLNRAAFTVGGYISGGVVGEVDAIAALEDAIRRKPNVADMRAAERTIRDGIRDGKQQPIYAEPLASAVPMSHVPKTGRCTFKRESSIAESDCGPVIVSTIADHSANPGSILRPTEAQLDREVENGQVDELPLQADWNEANAPDAVPLIKEIGVYSRDFFKWQRNQPPFNQLGLASLQPKTQP
ncbi:BT4734/BF3469 family protein [Spirosoma areae]